MLGQLVCLFAICLQREPRVMSVGIFVEWPFFSSRGAEPRLKLVSFEVGGEPDFVQVNKCRPFVQSHCHYASQAHTRAILCHSDWMLMVDGRNPAAALGFLQLPKSQTAFDQIFCISVRARWGKYSIPPPVVQIPPV